MGESSQAGLVSISYNVLRGEGFSTPKQEKSAVFDQLQAQWPTRLALELALYRPDIITLSEAPRQEIVAEIAKQLGMNHAYFPSRWSPQDPLQAVYPGAVLSRFEILEAQDRPQEVPDDTSLFTRHWGRAVVRTPWGDVVVFSAHLFPFETDDQDRPLRARELERMEPIVRKDVQAGRLVLFQGDLNEAPDAANHDRWKQMGLMDTFAAKGMGDQQFSYPSNQPRVRLDYIWASKGLAERLRGCRILDEGAFVPYPEDPRHFALSDHLPVMARFE